MSAHQASVSRVSRERVERGVRERVERERESESERESVVVVVVASVLLSVVVLASTENPKSQKLTFFY